MRDTWLYVIILSISVIGYGVVFVGQRLLEVHGLTLFGMAINFTVLPKYGLAVIHAALMGLLFPNSHPLNKIWQYFLIVLVVLLLGDFVVTIAIKKQVMPDISLLLHRLFLQPIKWVGTTVSIVIGILLHKLKNKGLIA